MAGQIFVNDQLTLNEISDDIRIKLSFNENANIIDNHIALRYFTFEK